MAMRIYFLAGFASFSEFYAQGTSLLGSGGGGGLGRQRREEVGHGPVSVMSASVGFRMIAAMRTRA
jgi:hypothetical protein